jgi:stage II sporulation protein P
MDHQQRSLGIGSVLIVSAVILRLLSVGALEPLAAMLEDPDTAAFLLYLETGRVVKPTEPVSTLPPEAPAPETTGPAVQPQETTPLPVATEPEEVYCFSGEDAALVDVRYYASYRPDLQAMVTQPLDWELVSAQPTVLIFHSHATESYLPDGSYTESSPYRTLDTTRNMVSIGEYLTRLLEAGGVRVLHDTGLHDYPSYNGSYSASRKSVQGYLRENPQLLLILDLHRDGVDGKTQPDTSAQVNGGEAAQLMLVVGTRQQGWEQNMALAVKLTAVLEKLHPGVTRPISFRTQQFNQDLSPGALLVEVGAAGNTHQEALRAVEALAEGILTLARGANSG